MHRLRVLTQQQQAQWWAATTATTVTSGQRSTCWCEPRRLLVLRPTTQLLAKKAHARGRTLSGTVTYHVSPLESPSFGGGSSTAAAGSSSHRPHGGHDNNFTQSMKRMAAGDTIALPTLRCPGGPRIKAEGIKHLYKVPHAGYLAKYDQRFMLNLKLTHHIASHLSRTTLRTSDKLLIELGPGAGSLTRSLLTRPCVGVLGVESDERFNAHLEQIRGYTKGKFQWVNADVLALDELALLKRYYPAFVQQHLRQRPGTEEKSSSSSFSSRGEFGEGAAPWEEGEQHEGGFEGAPLRSAQRERLLRQRRARFGGGGSGLAGGSPRGHERNRANTSYHQHSYEGEDRTAPTGDGASAAALGVGDRWWSDGDAKLEVVANLPFSVITELLMRYAVDCSRRANLFQFGRVPLHVFTQKEVADRIVAAPGSIHFSRLSVLCQAFFHVRVQQVFTEWTYYPKTEVLGAMLTLEPRVVPLGWSADKLSSGTQQQQQAAAPHAVVDGSTLIHFTDLVMKAGHRGSSIHKALSAFMPPEVVQYVLQASSMDGAMTVLDLSVDELVRMAAMWKAFLTLSHDPQQSQH